MLKRIRHPMPDFVRDALVRCNRMAAYRNRPPYQRNDYIGWIMRAKKEETRRKRLDRMLDELKDGHLYMNMKYRVGRR